MGFRFRKSFNLGGARVNIGKRGITSLSVGRKGATLNLGKKGVRSTVSVPKTGLSYSSMSPYKKKKTKTKKQKQTGLSLLTVIFYIIIAFVLYSWIFGQAGIGKIKIVLQKNDFFVDEFLKKKEDETSFNRRMMDEVNANSPRPNNHASFKSHDYRCDGIISNEYLPHKTIFSFS